jgi:hypothetical protein
MGGVVKGVGKAVGKIAPFAGPVVGGLTGGPMGFASSLASNALQGNYGGGGGGSNTQMYAKPNYSYGNQTYQYGNKPVDASKYFITGDKGVYNLMPALGQIDAKALQSSNPMYSDAWSNSISNKTYYTPYEAYTDLSKQMANDPKALAAFQAAYKPTTPTKSGVSPYVDFGMSGSIGEGSTFADLAKYASTNQNPYYMPFDASGGKASGFTPAPSGMELRRMQSAERDAAFQKLPPAEREAIMEQKALNRQDRLERLERRNTTGTGSGLAGLLRGRR